MTEPAARTDRRWRKPGLRSRRLGRQSLRQMLGSHGETALVGTGANPRSAECSEKPAAGSGRPQKKAPDRVLTASEPISPYHFTVAIIAGFRQATGGAVAAANGHITCTIRTIQLAPGAKPLESRPAGRRRRRPTQTRWCRERSSRSPRLTDRLADVGLRHPGLPRLPSRCFQQFSKLSRRWLGDRFQDGEKQRGKPGDGSYFVVCERQDYSRPLIAPGTYHRMPNRQGDWGGSSALRTTTAMGNNHRVGGTLAEYRFERSTRSAGRAEQEQPRMARIPRIRQHGRH